MALVLLDVVDQLDLSGLYEHYRSDGLGRAAYEPPSWCRSSFMQALATAGVREPIGAVVADAGCWSPQSAAATAGPELFIATRAKPGRGA